MSEFKNKMPLDYYGTNVVSGFTDFKSKKIDYSSPSETLKENLNYTTDEYFETKFDGKMFDMAFIDASHDYERTLQYFLNIKDYINPDGIIFFHDTYPSTMEETKPNLCGDCYKLPEKIRFEHNDEFEILTIPVNPGLSMARKVKKHIGDEK